MQKFELTIFNQTRVIFGILLTPIILIIFLFFSLKFDFLLIGLFAFIVYLIGLIYFLIGHLTIILENDILYFNWRKKLFLNFKEIDNIKISDIKTIVVDNDEFLRKIITIENKIFKINNGKISKKDSLNFIKAIKNKTKNQNTEIKDSWDLWVDKGLLKIAYYINSCLILTSIIIVTIISFKFGFKVKYLFSLLLFIPQLVIYKRQMKSKIEK